MTEISPDMISLVDGALMEVIQPRYEMHFRHGVPYYAEIRGWSKDSERRNKLIEGIEKLEAKNRKLSRIGKLSYWRKK